MKGTVESLDYRKRRGIIRDANGNHYLFRRAAMVRPSDFGSLLLGKSVTFQVEADARATHVTLEPTEP